MAPNPQNVIINRETPQDTFEMPLTGDEIVISGMSGTFPKSENTLELMENLYNKVDMVEEVNCSAIKHPNLPKHYGKIKNLQKFDAQFFRVTHWQAATLDPFSRKVMEHAYSAIYDSGINPLLFSGTKLGVFMGSSFSDNAMMNLYDVFQKNSFIISGCSKTMVANRVSYWIDGKGPSYGIDQACTGSMACLEIAYNSIKRGDCDAALVGGCSMCLHPMLSLNLKSAGHLCMDGKTKCFDKNGDGFVRAEAVSLLFLQKAKDAKRIYTEICHIKGKYFTRPDANFLPIRNSEDIEQFLKEFYEEIKVSPSEVEYVEAFGSGFADADSKELDAIGNFFAKSRSIKVGSIKSNMGNSESANGACSLTKLCLAYHKGELPANLHYNEPQDHIPAVREERIQVVTENTPFSRGFTALNNFSLSGSNFHVLLKGHFKNKDNSRYKSNIPRLVLLSGRDEHGVNRTINKLKCKPIDPEQIALLHNIYKTDIPGHTGRGYTILGTNGNNETISLASNFEFYSGTRRPICFLYSGMGSQWNGMGTELLRIPIFAAAIERCCKVLEPLGVDLVKIITDSDKSIFDNILNSMVGISAIQIGLTDVLNAMGIVPDNVIGHSIGELGCAYADGCLTAEEMILSSYYRGFVSSHTPFIRGSMAAIGLGYTDVLPLCPPEIEVACHNSAQSSTISGPFEDMQKFISELTNRGIFAKEVQCSNIAYHSRYIAEAGPALLTSMGQLVKVPKLRSEKWISSSIPQDQWDQEFAKYSSAEYFTNNLLSPVLFEENASNIPKNAVMIEIAPHGLLQSIVKKSHSECVNLSLTKRSDIDSVSYLLQGIGKLYQTGLNPKIDVLYPMVQFPVSTETSMLSHLVEWEHSVDWPETSFSTKQITGTSARNFVISVHDDDYSFIQGHARNGINEVPESALLVFVWETLAMYKGKYYKDMSVTFHDVTFHCQLKIQAKEVLRLRVTIQDGSNQFEIFTGNTHLVSGFVKSVANRVHYEGNNDTSEGDILLSGQDFYTLLRTKGYSYGNDFKCVDLFNTTRNTAYVKSVGQWATFLDSLLQLNAFVKDHDGISTPKIIKNLSIYVEGHKNEETTAVNGVNCYKAEIVNSNTLVRCGGVVLDGVIFNDTPKLNKLPDVLVTREFVPHELEETVNIETAISIILQLVADNVDGDRIKVLELVNSYSENLSNNIKKELSKLSTQRFDVNRLEVNNGNINTRTVIGTNLFVLHNFFGNKKIMNVLNQVLEDNNAFVLTIARNESYIKTTGFKVITTIPIIDTGILILLKTEDRMNKENVIYIPIEYDRKFSWLPRVQKELQKSNKVILVSEKEPNCGLLGFVKYLNSGKGNKIGVVIVDDYHASPFNPEDYFYKKQLDKKLTFNILKKGLWGSYYYVPNSKPAKLQNVSLTNTSVGNLDSLTWIESSKQPGNLVQVSYAGISARDCQKALGNVIGCNPAFGMDFSGIDSRGEQVMGLVAGAALSSTVNADPTLLWPVPQHWNLQDAATVPLPYIHAYYILVMKGEIKRKQRVFVTGGAGALGQAVIAICHSLNCTVFTTVSDEKKKIFLLKLFPKLKDENVAYSRHESFFTQIKSVTKNKRCDLVINCSIGPLREAAMKCVAFLGTFIDVSNEDINANKNFGMFYLQEDRQYKTVDLSSLFKPENLNDRKGLQILMEKGIANGIVRPLTRVVYSPLEVSRAFRLVSSSRHRGRCLIEMSDSKSLASNDNIIPSMMYPEGVHIVVCDRSNLGVELTEHLIRKGAKKIVIHLKKDYQASYLYVKEMSWEKSDITMKINSENLETKKGCEELFKVGRKLGEITSIFIVHDYKEKVDNDIIEQEELKSSFCETTAVTSNLDMVSRNISDLSHFVLVSVMSQNIGSEHAISTCERICEERNKIGLPALVLRTNIPNAISENKTTLLQKLDIATLSSLFNAMDISLKLKHNNVLTFNLPKTETSDVSKELEHIMGVHNIDNFDDSLTLKEVNVNDMVIEEIKAKLTPVTYSTDELLELTVASVQTLCDSLGKKRNINFEAGLAAFYGHVEKNEYVAVDALISMNTQLISLEDVGYIDRSENHLMFIPGFDGRYQVFESVAERLKIRAATLQLGPDLICESIPEMAKTLANHIKSHFGTQPKFYIFGYSFGVNVALEVAKILEADGQTGVVYCLDSSPDALKSQLKAYIGNLTDAQLQNAVLAHMYHLMTGQGEFKLKQELERTDSWSEKIEICMKSLQGLVHFSIEYRRAILESAYKRILLAKEYEPDFKLNSELVLMKGIPHPTSENLAEDYNLSKYTKHPVKVFDIESDHATAPYDYRVSNIVNKMLDVTLLKEFKQKNLCEYYL